MKNCLILIIDYIDYKKAYKKPAFLVYVVIMNNFKKRSSMICLFLKANQNIDFFDKPWISKI
jgi:hypothetical protein